MVFCRLCGPFEASFYKLLLAEAVKKGKETRLATFGCQLRPPPLQIGINAKLLKISPNWLVDG